jgi:hypothetical protein
MVRNISQAAWNLNNICESLLKTRFALQVSEMAHFSLSIFDSNESIGFVHVLL